LLRNVVSEAKKDLRDWSDVSLTLAARWQSLSPFNILALLPFAAEEVFCAGTTLRHIASTPDVADKIFEWLKADKSRHVRLLIPHPDQTSSLVSAGVLNKEYRRDLEDSHQKLQTWKNRAAKDRLKPGQLETRVTDEGIPLTLQATDPRTARGQLVLTPVFCSKPISGERPHFWLSKERHAEAFMYYWQTIDHMFSRASPI
jgi:hypothetical protein